MAERDDELEKAQAEPSRSEASTPAARSYPHFGSHKLRTLAASGLGEAGAMQAAVTRMMRTQPEDPTTSPVPHVVTIDDVTRGLGLEQADEQRVQRLVSDTSPEFSQKTQTQRVVHARERLVSVMRDGMRHVDADKRGEVTRRAMAFWRRNYQTDYGKAPTVRFMAGGRVEKSMDGDAPIPVIPLEQLGAVDPVLAHIREVDDELEKGGARGGKYYRRVPTGNPKRPWRYYYTREEYEREHGPQGHLHGPEVAQQRQLTLELPERKKPEQTGFDFGGAAPSAASPSTAPAATKPAATPLAVPGWMERRRDDALSVVARGDAGRIRTRLDGVRAVIEALEGPGADRGKAWLREHVLKPLEDALAKLSTPAAEPKLVIPLDGRPKAAETGLAGTGVPAAAPPAWKPEEQGRPPPKGVHTKHLTPKAFQDYLAEHAKKTDQEVAEGIARIWGEPVEMALERVQRARGTAPKPEPVAEQPKGKAPEGYAYENVHVGGDTFLHRQAIKEAGGRWDGANKQWVVPAHAIESLRAKLPAGAVFDAEHGTIAVGKKGKPTSQKPAPDPFAEFETPAVTRPEPEPVAAPAPSPEPAAVPVQAPPGPPGSGGIEFGEAPPGGWTDADRVKNERAAAVEEVRTALRDFKAKKAAQQERMSRFTVEPGDKLVIDGKEYIARSKDTDIAGGKYGRRVVLEPTGRARNPRELLIRPSGQIEIMSLGGRSGIVETIEGGRTRVTPWGPPAPPAPVVITTPTPPPTPPPTPGPSSPGTTSGPSGPSGEGAKKPPTAFVIPTNAKPTEGTPRAEAAAASKKLDGEYVNARASAVPNAGEDLLESARHRALEWKNLGQALDSKDAEQLFTRDFLERQEPVDLVSRAQRDKGDYSKSIANLYLHYLGRKFPGRPSIPQLIDNTRGNNVAWYDGDRYRVEYKYGSSSGVLREGAGVTREEHERKQREQYYEAWKAMRETLHKLADSPGHNAADLPGMERAVLTALREVHDKFVQRYGHHSAGTDAIATLYEAVRKGRRMKTSPIGSLNEFSKRLIDTYKTDRTAMVQQTGEHALRIIEGQSLNAAFGTKKEQTRGFQIHEAYDTDVMRRSGPASEYRDAVQAVTQLKKGGKYGMRGVQWGESVTDEERRHHAKSLLDSFQDLTDVLGLPAGMASYNGKLGIAVGARGRAGALAHYEPQNVVINLTRASGAGSLAHEWGHFFDYQVGQAAGVRQLSSPTGTPDHGTVARAVWETKLSPGWTAFSERLRRVLREKVRSREMSDKKAAYWQSHDEMFARAFERYVQRKLQKAGRENTYLVAVRKAASQPDGFWPTDEEVDAMTPFFDNIFATFRVSDLLHKALGVGRYAIAEEYRHLVRGGLVIPKGM